MEVPEVVYEVWSRSPGKLNDQLVSYFTTREAAKAGVQMFQGNLPGYDYFIREYKNPAYRG